MINIPVPVAASSVAGALLMLLDKSLLAAINVFKVDVLFPGMRSCIFVVSIIAVFSTKPTLEVSVSVTFKFLTVNRYFALAGISAKLKPLPAVVLLSSAVNALASVQVEGQALLLPLVKSSQIRLV